MPKLNERIIRIDLTELEHILQKAGRVKPTEHLNDAHVEPNELVIRVLRERKENV